MNEVIQNPTLTPFQPKLGIKDRKDLFKTTRIGAADLNEPQLPLNRKLTLALGLAGIAACGGNTVDSTTTTPPTTISSTVPQETTTNLPPVTTTTTTVPETTTTLPEFYCYPSNTEVPPINILELPIDIVEPTGNVIQNGEVVNLGSFEYSIHAYLSDEQSFISRLIQCYETISVSSNGNEVTSLFAKVVAGKYTDGSPIIATINFGMIGIDTIGQTLKEDTEEITEGEISPQAVNQLDDLIPSLIRRLRNNSEVGLVINTHTLNSASEIDQYYQNCIQYFTDQGYVITDRPGGGKTVEEICRESTDTFVYESSNRKELADLLVRGNINPNEWSEDKFINPSWVFFFTP